MSAAACAVEAIVCNLPERFGPRHEADHQLHSETCSPSVAGYPLWRNRPDFLVTCNGGHVDYEAEVTFDDGTKRFLGFSDFYEVSNKERFGANPFELNHARRMEGFPKEGVLPIARDGGGSQLFLDLREDCCLVAFVHGLPAWTGLQEQDSLLRVAVSFSDYWEQLCISRDYAECIIRDYDPKHGSVQLLAEWLDSGIPNWREQFGDIWQSCVVDALTSDS